MKTDNILRDSITMGVTSVDFSKSGSMTEGDSPVSDSRVARAKASLIGANFFVETNRFEPLMAVYLIGKFEAHTRRHVQKMLSQRTLSTSFQSILARIQKLGRGLGRLRLYHHEHPHAGAPDSRRWVGTLLDKGLRTKSYLVASHDNDRRSDGQNKPQETGHGHCRVDGEHHDCIRRLEVGLVVHHHHEGA